MYRELDPHVGTEEAEMKDAAHRFAADVLRPTGAALDRVADPAEVAGERSRLWPALRQAYRLGYHRVAIPAELGGLGASGLAQHVLFEELGWGSADLAVAIAMAAFPFVVIARTGNPRLIDDFVRPFVEDREARHVGCWAITEPAHGSDAFMIGTPQFVDPRISADVIARRDREYYVLNGQKAAWVTNATIATHALVFLGIDPARGMEGGGVALVPINLRGVSRGKPVDMMGQRGLNQSEISFDEVRIHESQLLTDPTLYEFMLDRAVASVAALMGAIFTGVARAAYEAALDHARERVQGGRPIAEHQLVQKRLFDMFSRVEACRAVSRAVMVHDTAAVSPATEHAIAAKTFCTEAAVEVTSSALGLFGGEGLTRGNPVGKLFRDARASLTEYGSNDVLALVAARRLLARRSFHEQDRTLAEDADLVARRPPAPGRP
jgi:alkylation response protein AidB-like acyl-CoA dehydrogenase